MWIPGDKGKCQGPEGCRSASQETPVGGACSRSSGLRKARSHWQWEGSQDQDLGPI